MKYILAATLSALLFLTVVAPVSALVRPEFPSCENPSGTVIASFPEGVHGIVGDSRKFTGSDNVYRLDDYRVLQCFCPDNGDPGIQTTWWRLSSLSEDEKSILKREGWILVPNGSLWGLAEGEYFAKNSSFSCSGRGGVVGTTGQVLGLADTGVPLKAYAFPVGGVVLAMIAWRLRNTR